MKIGFILFTYFFILQNSHCDDATTTTPEPKDPVEVCIEESKVSPKLVKKLQGGNWKMNDIPLKKWALCYLVNVGLMSPLGILRQDMVLKDIPTKDKFKVEKAINLCLYRKRHDPVETAWHYLTCFRSKEPKYAKIANRI